MASACMVISRKISTSSVCYGKRNFRKFLLYNKRGLREFKQKQATDPNFEMPFDKRGVRDIYITDGDDRVIVPEKIPEIIVPSLKDFHLKPYVSYRAGEIEQRPFTAKDLFDFVYADKIKKDFETGQLGPDGEPLNPSKYESMTPEEARLQAEKTGTDLFTMEIEKA
ncbi:39S ribosomal protein L41, mitochondrial [Hylaeus anthracinus]|uniref:39S ribosomal protein L41, mitochondrial n=1 Tax=Hylaeus anthracinus TaxID=313031 RepID=UPI0023B96F28|nr:39S ribosomal protein L41, mitochondrial [Hylaeus anthracinus]